MSESTVPSIRPERTHIVTLPGTSSSGTIADVGTLDFSTGPRNRSTTSIWTGSSQRDACVARCYVHETTRPQSVSTISIWTGSSQRELTINRLSGKLGAHQAPAPGAGTPAGSRPAPAVAHTPIHAPHVPADVRRVA